MMCLTHVVLIDDVGFGASSVFGGPCKAPTDDLREIDERAPQFHLVGERLPQAALKMTGL
jgi:hypothetical protein